MNRKVNFRRGATLVELSITLAVLAAAAVLVVSFSLVISRQVNAARQRQAARDELVLAQQFVQNWVDFLLVQGAEVTDGESEYLSVALSGEIYTLTWDAGSLTAAVPLGTENSLNTSYIQDFSVSILWNEERSDSLIFCTLQFRVPEEAVEDYTFSLNPHVGEQYPGGGTG